MAMPRPIFAALLFAFSLTVGSRALASSDYPEALQEASGAPCPPPCTVCHQTLNGGAGTATKPFADTMIREGDLDGKKPSLVAPAVAAVSGSGADSDGDGFGDIAELASGWDPNARGEGDLCGPQYGCGARVAPGSKLDVSALALALMAAGLLLARARRRSASSARST
jgi:hypothetical protein